MKQDVYVADQTAATTVALREERISSLYKKGNFHVNELQSLMCTPFQRKVSL